MALPCHICARPLSGPLAFLAIRERPLVLVEVHLGCGLRQIPGYKEEKHGEEAKEAFAQGARAMMEDKDEVTQ